MALDQDPRRSLSCRPEQPVRVHHASGETAILKPQTPLDAWVWLGYSMDPASMRALRVEAQLVHEGARRHGSDNGSISTATVPSAYGPMPYSPEKSFTALSRSVRATSNWPGRSWRHCSRFWDICAAPAAPAARSFRVTMPFACSSAP